MTKGHKIAEVPLDAFPGGFLAQILMLTNDRPINEVASTQFVELLVYGGGRLRFLASLFDFNGFVDESKILSAHITVINNVVLMLRSFRRLSGIKGGRTSAAAATL